MQVFDGNGMNGFFARDSILTGVAFLGSVFNRNGMDPMGGDGIRFLRSTVNQGTVTLEGIGLSSIVTLTTGFTLKDAEVVGNTMNGVEFDTVTATDVTFDNATIASNGGDGLLIDPSSIDGLVVSNARITGNAGNGIEITDSAIDDIVFDGGTRIANNVGAGILISAIALEGTDGSILFGDTGITGNVTGILVEDADAMMPLHLTFGSTRISGGVDGLVLSGPGIALTGGGGMIPGGSSVGGGTTPGDGLFGGSLGTLAFSGQSGDFIRLENGALFNPGMPTVIDASNVTFDGVPAGMLTVKERNDAAAKIIDFNDDDTLGLLFLPPAVQGRPINILPSPAENRGLVPRLPDQGNTPGDTLFLLTGGAEFNPYAINLNLFCSSYSLATSTGEENSQGGATCLDLTGSPTPGTPNEFLRNFWRAWQAARS
jgi:hypothetical protein